MMNKFVHEYQLSLKNVSASDSLHIDKQKKFNNNTQILKVVVEHMTQFELLTSSIKFLIHIKFNLVKNYFKLRQKTF